MLNLVLADTYSALPTPEERAKATAQHRARSNQSGPTVLRKPGHGFTRARIEADDDGRTDLDAIARNKIAVAELAIVKRLSEVIEREYPGNPFKIACDVPAGVAYIWIPLLMGWSEKYVIHLTYLASDPTCKIAVKYAGEILERYKIRRGSFSESQYVDAVHTIPPFLRGTYGQIPR